MVCGAVADSYWAGYQWLLAVTRGYWGTIASVTGGYWQLLVDTGWLLVVTAVITSQWWYGY